METTFTSFTIGATALQLSAAKMPCCKISVQSAPGATGNVKIGRGANLTSDNTTAGTFLSATAATNPDASKQAGGSWVVETGYKDYLDASQYWIHGTHAGDVVMVEFHQSGSYAL